MPIDIGIMIPKDDSVRLFNRIVEEMDLSALYATYERLPGVNHASPRTMLKIVLYAFHERIYSTREIEKRCMRDINFRYLLGGVPAPDHSTIGRFVSGHYAQCCTELASLLVEILHDNGEITDTEVFIDGTKIESSANRYTFVWKKAVTKRQARFLQKAALLAGDIYERYGLKIPWKKQIKKKHLKKLVKILSRIADEEGIAFAYGRGHAKPRIQKDIEDLKAAVEKIKEYETQLYRCGGRNSYSKTDVDATFMHMKDDHMKNGQLKPAYNLQHAVNSGYIVMTGIFQSPTDTGTLKPFLEMMEKSLSFKFADIVADAGYESEENLVFIEENGQQAFIKPSNYEQTGTKKFSREIGRKENMEYDPDNDRYTCRNGKHVEKADETVRKTKSGYERHVTRYHCSECTGCPYKNQCIKGTNWKKPEDERFKTIEVSKEFERLRSEEYERIDSEKGKKLRMNRSIQVEGSFGDIKADGGFDRYLRRGTENVLAESTLLAMAHNIGWLHSRIQGDRLGTHLYELKEAS